MKLYSWENHRTIWWIFQSAVFDHWSYSPIISNPNIKIHQNSPGNSRKSPWAKSICGPFGLFWSSMLGFTMFQVRHIVKLWLAGNGEIIRKFLRNTRFSHWKFHWRGSGLWCEGALKQVEACNPKPGSYAPGETCKASSVDRTIIGSSVYLSICLYSIRIILYWWLYYIEHDLSYLY